MFISSTLFVRGVSAGYILVTFHTLVSLINCPEYWHETHVKPLIVNLNHTCTYICSQGNSLVHTFEAHEIHIEAQRQVKKNLRDDSEPGHNIKKCKLELLLFHLY